MGKVWKETGGEAEALRRMEETEEREEWILSELEPCCICGGEPRAEILGLFGEGVMIGCDRSAECKRNIERHSEGWSLEEVAEDWNKRNSGARKWIRLFKSFFRRRYGKIARMEKREKKEKRKRELADRKRRMEIFGIEEKRKHRFRLRFSRGKKR